MSRTKKTQDFYDYQFQRNLKPVKRYKFFDKIFKIKNGSAATIFAENCYTQALDCIDAIEGLDEKEDFSESDAKEILEIQIEITNLVKNGLSALVGSDNADYIFNYENEEGAGLDMEDLIAIFTEIYMISKGGNPDDANFRNESETK